MFLTRFFGRNKSFREGLAVWKFALFASLAMVIPYLIVAHMLGPEFPSLIGSLVGLAIVTTGARKGFLMPHKEEHWEFDKKENWDPQWSGKIEISVDEDNNKTMSLAKAWSPYLLVVLLLFVTRLKTLPFVGLVNPLAAGIKSWTVTFPNLFGTGITSKFQPLYLPGTIFILVSLITCFLHDIDWPSYKRAWTNSLRTGLAASIALVFTVPMVQVFINSDGGAAEYANMPIALAEGVAALAGSAWPIFSPFIRRIGVDPTWIVALQVVGGAAGNMICVHNVVAASAVVGLLGKEGLVIRRTLLPFVYYSLLVGAVGYSIVWFAKNGVFNLGTMIAVMIAVAAVVVITYGQAKKS
jgi:lactate permease